MSILVTGGTGYIGSHTCVELINQGYSIVIVDDLSNSSQEAVKRVKEITSAKDEQVVFYQCSILDREKLEEVFKEITGKSLTASNLQKLNSLEMAEWTAKSMLKNI